MSRLPKHFFTVAAVAAFLGLGFVLFGSTGHDDSHITYWVAHSLQKYGQLLNYNGDRIEQSSSLAHVLLLALLGKVTGVQLPTLGPITSIVAGVAAIILVARLVRLAAPSAPRGIELLVGTAECFIYWGFGGLETTILAAAVVWVVYACARYLEAPSALGLASAGAAMALYVTSRPESPLVLGCILAAGLGYVGYRRFRFGEPGGPIAAVLRPPIALALIAAVECAIVFGFRKKYFGLWFPNPVYSKVPGLAILDGLGYVITSLFPAALWVLPGVYFGVRHVVRTARDERAPQFGAVLSAAFVVAYLSFVVLVGGDWMRGARFFAHAFPLIAVVTAIGITSRIQGERRAQIATWILVGLNLAGTVLLAFGKSNGRPIWTTPGIRAQVDARIGDRGFSWFEVANVVHLRDAPVTAAMLELVEAIRAKHPERKVVFMSTQAGMVTYHVAQKHFGEIRYLDTCSLATRDFLACAPAWNLLDDMRFGMTLSYETYFGNQARINTACGTPRPDIVFAVTPTRDIPVLKEHGYTIYYEQKGPIRGKKTSFNMFPSDQFVAVDTKLLKEIGLAKKDRYVWDIR